MAGLCGKTYTLPAFDRELQQQASTRAISALEGKFWQGARRLTRATVAAQISRCWPLTALPDWCAATGGPPVPAARDVHEAPITDRNLAAIVIAIRGGHATAGIAFTREDDTEPEEVVACRAEKRGRRRRPPPCPFAAQAGDGDGQGAGRRPAPSRAASMAAGSSACRMLAAARRGWPSRCSSSPTWRMLQDLPRIRESNDLLMAGTAARHVCAKAG